MNSSRYEPTGKDDVRLSSSAPSDLIIFTVFKLTATGAVLDSYVDATTLIQQASTSKLDSSMKSGPGHFIRTVGHSAWQQGRPQSRSSLSRALPERQILLWLLQGKSCKFGVSRGLVLGPNVMTTARHVQKETALTFSVCLVHIKPPSFFSDRVLTGQINGVVMLCSSDEVRSFRGEPKHPRPPPKLILA
jgi:hypothetical protein